MVICPHISYKGIETIPSAFVYDDDLPRLVSTICTTALYYEIVLHQFPGYIVKVPLPVICEGNSAPNTFAILSTSLIITDFKRQYRGTAQLLL